MAMEQTKKEVEAIAFVMEKLEGLSQDSQRRVIWYAADSLGLSEHAQRPNPTRGPATRTIPLPPGTDPKTVTDALRAAGVPVNP